MDGLNKKPTIKQQQQTLNSNNFLHKTNIYIDAKVIVLSRRLEAMQPKSILFITHREKKHKFHKIQIRKEQPEIFETKINPFFIHFQNLTNIKQK